MQNTTITIRQIAPDYAKMDRHWFEQNPFLSHFLNSLFFLFPPGERLFVNAVKRFVPELTDPTLKDAVKKFIIQESNHGKSHEDLNLWLDSAGMDTSKTRARINRSLERLQTVLKSKPMLLLAITVAAEHLTAVMAAEILRRDEELNCMAPPARALTIWHAVEEIEHKAVAFDVYQAVGGGYALRVTMLTTVTAAIFVTTVARQLVMVARDGELFNLRAAARCVSILIGRRGFFTGMAPQWFAYFRPGFHPADSDDSALLTKGAALLSALTYVKTQAPRKAPANAS